MPDPPLNGDHSRVDLPGRLHDETAELRHSVEQRVGVPESVRNRTDYVRLLERSLAMHTAIEIRLDAPAWSSQWRGLGVILIDHRRTALLQDDLRNLGGDPSPRPLPPPEITTFAQALGCLYAIEQAALSARKLAPAIQARIGRVPTTFLDDDLRGHPRPWHATVNALRRYEEARGDVGDVVLGARITFRALGEQIAHVRWTNTD